MRSTGDIFLQVKRHPLFEIDDALAFVNDALGLKVTKYLQ